MSIKSGSIALIFGALLVGGAGTAYAGGTGSTGNSDNNPAAIQGNTGTAMQKASTDAMGAKKDCGEKGEKQGTNNAATNAASKMDADCK